MDILKTGGVADSASDLNALPRRKPDISAALHQARESLNNWRKQVTDGEVESLVVNIDTLPPHNQARTLSDEELLQLRETKVQIGDYLDRVLRTASPK